MDEQAKVAHILEKYRRTLQQLQDEGRAKPDMIAFSQLKKELTPPDKHGHVPGVKPGDAFNSRGELAIVGLHTLMMAGISFKTTDKRGAYAVVLSGGYKDDVDEGTRFWYTGAGGQDKTGKQVVDQEYEKGNLALKQSYETQTPVRVIRGTVDASKKRKYIYEGLYHVKECTRVKSQHSAFKVCKFLLEGIPGESVASVVVKHNINTAAPPSQQHLHHHRLALELVPGPKAKRQKIEQAEDMAKDQHRQARLQALKGRPGLVMSDISKGQEAVPIPLFNEVNNEQLLPTFHYIADYEFAPGVQEQVQGILQAEDQKMRRHVNFNKNGECGIKFNCMMREADIKWAVRQGFESPAEVATPEESYNTEGLLLATEPCGVHECGPECTDARCITNQQVTHGIVLPLEVFMTTNKGWGVRCTDFIASGAFICSYVGSLITEAMAEQEQANPHLFPLDFFMHIFKEIHERGLDGICQTEMVPEHKIPPPPTRPFPEHLVPASTSLQQASAGAEQNPCNGTTEDFRPLLVVDAAMRGNVGRLINHSCDANLTIQAVFAKKCRNTLLYYIALFAAKDIPPMTELTYDYGYHKQGVGCARDMVCHCGAPNCTGKLV